MPLEPQDRGEEFEGVGIVVDEQDLHGAAWETPGRGGTVKARERFGGRKDGRGDNGRQLERERGPLPAPGSRRSGGRRAG